MIATPDELVNFYRGITPQTGYIYYFLDENVRSVSRDQLKIGVGFYRSDWIDGSFLFESDSYLLKSLMEFLAGRYLKHGNFPVWSEWTYYYARLWAAIGICRLMGMGSFYLRGHGPVMILRKKIEEIPGTVGIEVAKVKGGMKSDAAEGYLVYRDPGGGAHVRNWKLFYVVLSEILSKTGAYDIDQEFIQAMSAGDPESRFVIKPEEEIYGFPSLYRVKEISEKEAGQLTPEIIQSLDHWLENEAQFDGGGFTEEFKAYYKFMMDHYGREDELPDVLSIVEHGISWLMASLDDDIRAPYRNRYYELVKKYSPNDETRKMLNDWLDQVTKVEISGK